MTIDIAMFTISNTIPTARRIGLKVGTPLVQDSGLALASLKPNQESTSRSPNNKHTNNSLLVKLDKPSRHDWSRLPEHFSVATAHLICLVIWKYLEIIFMQCLGDGTAHIPLSPQNTTQNTMPRGWDEKSLLVEDCK